MGYGTQRIRYGARGDVWDARRILRWIFTLGFAREQASGPAAAEERQGLEDCGAVLPWVLPVAVLVWAQVYHLGFIAMLAFLEIQAVVLGLVTAAFVPRRSAATVLNTVVNVFLALLAAFLGFIVIAFSLGFIVLLASLEE